MSYDEEKTVEQNFFDGGFSQGVQEYKGFVRKKIEEAVHSIMFDGYDENSERALVEMHKYLVKELFGDKE